METALADKIADRHYTYVQAFWRYPCDVSDRAPLGVTHRVEYFIVWSPFKGEAMDRAKAYIAARWPFVQPAAEIFLYPRNYIDETRSLVARGRHDGEVAERSVA